MIQNCTKNIIRQLSSAKKVKPINNINNKFNKKSAKPKKHKYDIENESWVKPKKTKNKDKYHN